jgi:hypothetical protein
MDAEEQRTCMETLCPSVLNHLSILVYGPETWPLTLMEVHRLRLFENKVLRRIFIHKKKEVSLPEE